MIKQFAIITVLRPSGETEYVRMGNHLTDQRFAEIKTATAEAGKGEVLGYENRSFDTSAPKKVAYNTSKIYADHSETAKRRAEINEMSAGGEYSS